MHVSVGGFLFALVAWQLPGYWGISPLLAGAVWACLGSGSHRQTETRLCSTQELAGRDPGTQAGLGVVGRAGESRRVSQGPSQVHLRGESGEGCVCVGGGGNGWEGLGRMPFLGSVLRLGPMICAPHLTLRPLGYRSAREGGGGHGLRFFHSPCTLVLLCQLSLLHPIAKLLFVNPNPGPPPVRGRWGKVQLGQQGAPGTGQVRKLARWNCRPWRVSLVRELCRVGPGCPEPPWGWGLLLWDEHEALPAQSCRCLGTLSCSSPHFLTYKMGWSPEA